MVVGARSRTLRLSARQSGCFQRREHGRYLSPISTWKPQEKRMPIAVSNSGFHNSPRHPVANHVESHHSKARKFYLAKQRNRGRQSPFDSHRSEEHTSELQSRGHLVCRLLLEKK